MKLRGVLVMVTVAVLFTALDLWSKEWAFERVPMGTAEVVIPGFFNLHTVLNPGAAFGTFAGKIHFFYVVSVLATLLLGYFAWTAPKEAGHFYPMVLGCLGGGVFGNFYDRVTIGKVRDFFDVYVDYQPVAKRLVQWFGTNHWPVFNVADICICVGAFALLFIFMAEERAAKSAQATVPGTVEAGAVG